MKRLIPVFLSAALLLTGSAIFAAQQKPKISMTKAREIALKRVPGGKIQSEELENEKGKLIYSFDIKTNKPGVTEVNVDAMTGKLIDVVHETPAKEAAEKKREGKH